MMDGGFLNKIMKLDEYIPVQIYDTHRLIAYLSVYGVTYIGYMEDGIWMEKLEALPKGLS